MRILMNFLIENNKEIEFLKDLFNFDVMSN